MADVKKFNGFVGLDGGYYPTRKEALDATTEFKIQSALYDFRETVDETFDFVSKDKDTGELVIKRMYIEDFIYANRVKILAALTQKPLLKAVPPPKVAKPRRGRRPAIKLVAPEVEIKVALSPDIPMTSADSVREVF